MSGSFLPPIIGKEKKVSYPEEYQHDYMLFRKLYPPILKGGITYAWKEETRFFSPIYPTQQSLPCKQICLRINWKETNFSVRFSLT